MGISAETREAWLSAPGGASGLANALFSPVQQRVLGLLFANPGRSYYLNEIVNRVDSGTGAVQRQLARLEAALLVTVTRVGRQKHYRANEASPIFEELRGIALKTSGLADVLREALSPLEDIRAAFVFGSIARGEDRSDSDVDLLVVGGDDLGYAELFVSLESASSRLGRQINPTIHSPADVARRMREGNPFLMKVLAQPRIWVIGGEDALTP